MASLVLQVPHVPDNIFIAPKGGIYTGSMVPPCVEAMAVQEGMVTFVGSIADCKARYPKEFNASRIEIAGAVAGGIEGHGHDICLFPILGNAPSLAACETPQEAQQLIVETVQASREDLVYILDMTWDKHQISRGFLARLTKSVFVFHTSYHIALTNAQGLQYLGLSPNHRDVRDDWMVRKLDDHLFARLPVPENMEELILRRQTEVLSKGCTGTHDMFTHDVRVLQAVKNLGPKLLLNPHLYVPPSILEEVEEAGLLDMVHGVKLFADGANGARTMRRFDYYPGKPRTYGTFYRTKKQLRAGWMKGFLHGKQVACHVLGPAAADHYISVLELLNNRDGLFVGGSRLEHCQWIRPQELDRAALLGLRLCFQPNFCDEYYKPSYREILGLDFIGGINPIRSAIKAGNQIGFGMDGMPQNYFAALWWAMNHPIESERLSLEEAVHYFTCGAEALLGPEVVLFEKQDAQYGGFQPGCSANFVILGAPLKNLERITPEDVTSWPKMDRDVHGAVPIIATYVNGRQVWPV